MNTQSPSTRRERGFTLVELLVVIAIIGILAGIVVPNVPRYIMRSQYASAVSDITNAETALVGVLSDAGRSNFREFLVPIGDVADDCANYNNSDLVNFYHWTGRDTGCAGQAVMTPTISAVLSNYENIVDFYNQFFYELLRVGRNSDFLSPVGAPIIRPEVMQKLGTSYMNIEQDPWDSGYQFWMGPHRRGPMPLRSYRVLEGENPDGDEDEFTPYEWDGTNRGIENREVPGQPAADTGTISNSFTSNYNGFGTPTGQIRGYGKPAPREPVSSVYIWSKGPNLQDDASLIAQFKDGQESVFFGGGDDPSSWDTGFAGWDAAPK